MDNQKGPEYEARNDDAERVLGGLGLRPAQLGTGQRAPDTDHHHFGTIETIDQSKRAMNIKTADGKFVAVNVPESVNRFSELKVGDKLKATYNNNVVVRLKPPGEAAVDTASPVATAGMSSGTKGVVRTMTASVTNIDKSASSITFEGSNGWKYSRRVVDPKVFDQVKVGDKVDITWNTDLTVSVQ